MALLVLQLNDATELTWERHTGSYGPRPTEEQEPETAGKDSLAFIVARHELAQHFAGAWLAADPREPHCPPQPAVGWDPTSHRLEPRDPHDARRPARRRRRQWTHRR